MTCTLIVHYRVPQVSDEHFIVYLYKNVTYNYFKVICAYLIITTHNSKVLASNQELA